MKIINIFFAGDDRITTILNQAHPRQSRHVLGNHKTGYADTHILLLYPQWYQVQSIPLILMK